MHHKHFIYSSFNPILQTFLHTFTNTTWDKAKFIQRIFHNDSQTKKVPFIACGKGSLYQLFYASFPTYFKKLSFRNKKRNKVLINLFVFTSLLFVSLSILSILKSKKYFLYSKNVYIYIIFLNSFNVGKAICDCFCNLFNIDTKKYLYH